MSVKKGDTAIFMIDKDHLIEALLQERDEMYSELVQFRNIEQGALEHAEKKIERFETIVKEKDATIQKLSDQLAWFKRKYWRPSSEKHIPSDPNQRKIDFDGLDVLPEEIERIQEAAKEVNSYQKKKSEKKDKPVRTAIPEDLRREVIVIDPEGIDERWVKIGEEVSEKLELNPGEIYVLQIIRNKYALKAEYQAENDTKESAEAQKVVLIAPMPLQVIPRGNAGPSLISDLLISKYLYHIPFHRKIQMYKQFNFHLAASTANDIFLKGVDALRALYDRLKELVLARDYIQVDESTIPVINNEKHKAVKAYLWAVRSPIEKMVFFHYDRGSRAQAVVIDLLKDFKGAIQTDGYEAYNIYERKKNVLLLGCWAHARRKYNDAIKEEPAKVNYALEQIRQLYTVETMCDDANLTYEERAAERARLAYPIMVAFEKWIVKELENATFKGLYYKALAYSYKIFHRLSRYHLDGRYKMDNNLIENDQRGLALGRKNYLFAGNHEAAENAAVMYSLIACCKAAEVDPHQWLTDVLTKIPYYNQDYSKDLAELLPHNWKVSNSRTES